MSGQEKNQFELNNTPEQNSDGGLSNSDSASTPDHEPLAQGQEPPLPDFSLSSTESRSDKPSIRTSDASPSDLNKLLDAHQDPENPSETQSEGVEPLYRVSPAESDLGSYPVPGSDDPAPEEEETASGWRTTWSIVREVGETVILTLIIFFVIQMFVRNFRVVGTSMVSNLQNGQYLIIDKVTYNPFVTDTLKMAEPHRGDVIVFKPPRNPSEDYVKRVIGLPGEKVHIVKGQVFINDEPLEEPFEPIHGSYTMPSPVVVPEDQLFVLGDNRNNSNDSHNWGPLPIENIVGRAWISYWPPDLWGTIPRDAPSDEATLRYFINQVIPSANAKNE